MVQEPETIVVAGQRLTKQEYDGPLLYCGGESAIWQATSGAWHGKLIIGAAHFVVVAVESLGDVIAKLDKDVEETRAKLGVSFTLGLEAAANAIERYGAQAFDPTSSDRGTCDGLARKIRTLRATGDVAYLIAEAVRENVMSRFPGPLSADEVGRWRARMQDEQLLERSVALALAEAVQ